MYAHTLPRPTNLSGQFTEAIVAPYWPLGLNISQHKVALAAVIDQGIVIDWGYLCNVLYIDAAPGTKLVLSGLTLVSLRWK